MSKLRIIVGIVSLLLCWGCVEDDKQNPVSTLKPKVAVVPKTYLNFPYSKVLAFATVDPFDYSQLYYAKTMDLNKFHDTISRTLNKAEIKLLDEVLIGKYNQASLDEDSFKSSADCFLPRHNIAFLNQRDSVIKFISVCFECEKIKSSINSKADMGSLEMFFNQIGLKVIVRSDQYGHYYDSVFKQRTRRKKLN